jgi:fluoride ion exporter CrcB/FEX
MLTTMLVVSVITYVIILWLTFSEYKAKRSTFTKNKKVLYVVSAVLLAIIAGILVVLLGYLILTM